ncbi:MAG: PEGA domain-containing protein, partial [Acidobacteria bacterium]|nr:PEGA domain-containing protein [Acidobacteriota bacterium]
LKYLADRGTIDPATALVPDTLDGQNDYGSLLFVHAELAQRTKKALQSGTSASSARISAETQVLHANAVNVALAQQVEPTAPVIPEQQPSQVPPIPRIQRKWVGLGVGLAVVIAVILVLNWNVSLPIYSPGSLVLNVTPWANVDSITSVDSGEKLPIGEGLITPCVVQLPPGAYRVRVSNPYFGSLEFEVSVSEGEPTLMSQQLPDFKLEEEISAIFN